MNKDAEIKTENIDRLILLAEEGLKLWKEMKLDEYDLVMLLTDEDSENRKMFCRLFLKKLKAENKRGVIITHFEDVCESAKTIKISFEKSLAILQLMFTYEFTDKAVIGDFYRPKERKRLLNFIGFKGYDKEKAAAQAIFKIKED